MTMSFNSFLHWLSSKLSEMDVPSLYSFVSACLASTWLLLYGIYRVIYVITSDWLSTSSFILKHLFYPHIFPRIPLVGTATRFEALIAVTYLLTNLLIVMSGPRSEIGSRSATMSVINIIPLLCGHRLSLATKLFGISLRTSIGSHQWFGRTAVAQILLHTLVSLTGGDTFQWTARNLSGVVASSVCGIIFVFAVNSIRRAIYEWFLNTHLLLSVVIVIATWRHISSKGPAETFLQIGVGLWTVTTAIHWLFFVYRNLAFGRPFATAVAKRPGLFDGDKSSHTMVDDSNVFQVDVTVPRPWRVQAGESIFLSIPKLGIFTGLRGHPFMISWWERDYSGLTLSLLVEPRAGFTAKLEKYATRPNTQLRVFIDGPYGTPHDFGEFGTVIMFATGIGIAGHMAYIKKLIDGYNASEVKTRRVLLIWQIERQCHEKWVKIWMDELLHKDTGYILEVFIHILDLVKNGTPFEHGTYSKVHEKPGPPDIRDVLQTELRTQKGRMIVSLCANSAMADVARKEVGRIMDKRVRLVELDFQPSLRQTRDMSTADMEFQCRG